MVMVLEQEIVSAIGLIGQQRLPAEACGILLPVPYKGKQVWEMPNRSKKPHDSFELYGSDVLLELEGFFPSEPSDEFYSGLTIWHTHPGGNVGPSRDDLRNKPMKVRSLVVTLFDDGRRPLATWF